MATKWLHFHEIGRDLGVVGKIEMPGKVGFPTVQFPHILSRNEKVASSILAGGSIKPQLEQCSSWGIFLSSPATKSAQIVRAITERRQGTG